MSFSFNDEEINDLSFRMAVREVLDKELNKVYGRLQQAYEERDKYKKALEDIKLELCKSPAHRDHDKVWDIAKDALKG